jgi:hypothetical protein
MRPLLREAEDGVDRTDHTLEFVLFGDELLSSGGS